MALRGRRVNQNPQFCYGGIKRGVFMMTSPGLISLYALIPMAIALIGGYFATKTTFSKKAMSFVQHLLAGIVVAAVATELLPKIMGKGSPWTVGIGFALGATVMIGVHALAHLLGDKGKKEKIPLGLILGCALDLLIDGILIGVSFLAGTSGGILIAISLSFCAFFITLTLSSTLAKKEVDRFQQYLVLILTTVMLPIGALIGGTVVSHLPYQFLTETLAFGVAALLFLGVEELLGEAHATHDTAPITGAFFLGFLVILLLKL